MRRPTTVPEYALLALLSLLWGIAFVGIKEVLGEVSPVTLTVLRFAVADAALLALMVALPEARPRFSRGDLGRLVALGACGVPGYHLALNWGEGRTSASVAALIVATAPVMVAVLAATILRERVPARRVLGIVLAFGGVALVALTGEDDAGRSTASIAGILVALIAPAAWAVYTIVAKPLTERASALRVTSASMLLGTVGLLPFIRRSTVVEAAALTGEGWAWVALLGVGSSVAGYFIFVWALGRMEATRVAVFLYVVPVVALVAAWLILDEPLGVSVGAAAALVVAGVALGQERRTAGAPAPETPAEPTPARSR